MNRDQGVIKGGAFCREIGRLLLFLIFFAGSINAQSSIEDLRAILSRGSTEQKRSALAELRNIRSAEASEVAAAGLKDPAEIVRATAAAAVVYLPAERAETLLIPLLEDRSDLAKIEAAYALALVGGETAVAPLFRLLTRSKLFEVRAAAAVGLGGTGRMSALPPLIGVLRERPSEDNEFLRRSSARAIGTIAQMMRGGGRRVVTPQSFLPAKYKEIVLPEPPKEGFTESVTTLTRIVTSGREASDTRREAAFALGAIGYREALPVLERMTVSTDPYLSEAAREAVAKILSSKQT